MHPLNSGKEKIHKKLLNGPFSSQFSVTERHNNEF